MRAVVATLATIALLGCDDPVDPAAGSAPAAAEVVTPPFEVEGDAAGLLLVWFDADGVHSAGARSEIPESSREHVRVDSLRLPPEDRLDPAFVYVADLRRAEEGGRYVVRRMRRPAFDAMVDAATGGAAPVAGGGPEAPSTGDTDADVVIYGASWCGACRSAARFFRSHGVAFVERDIERDDGARTEMQTKMRSAGLRGGSIPVIDFRGTVMQGFDQPRIERLLRAGPTAI